MDGTKPPERAEAEAKIYSSNLRTRLSVIIDTYEIPNKSDTELEYRV